MNNPKNEDKYLKSYFSHKCEAKDVKKVFLFRFRHYLGKGL